jgi:hypothetical protein
VANATSIVQTKTVSRSNEFITRSVKTLTAETTFYVNAMIGVGTDGYLDKFDDTASRIFFGVVRGDAGNPKLPVATAGDDKLLLDVHQPLRFYLKVTGVAVTDIGKLVYASDDQTGVLTGTTYGNVIGKIVDKVATDIALVEPVYDGVAAHARCGAIRTMAATGDQTITRWDVGKTILVPNTAALTLNLPSAAAVQAGARLTFVKTTSNAQAITLDGSGSETIDGQATNAAMDANHDTITIVSDGTNWRIVCQKIAP